jgi:hypothetical protein
MATVAIGAYFEFAGLGSRLEKVKLSEGRTCDRAHEGLEGCFEWPKIREAEAVSPVKIDPPVAGNSVADDGWPEIRLPRGNVIQQRCNGFCSEDVSEY